MFVRKASILYKGMNIKRYVFGELSYDMFITVDLLLAIVSILLDSENSPLTLCSKNMTKVGQSQYGVFQVTVIRLRMILFITQVKPIRIIPQKCSSYRL